MDDRPAAAPEWCRQIALPAGPVWGCNWMSGFDGGELAARVWGGRATTDDSGLTAFGYLWRRFGPPTWGSDPSKNLCRYVCGTPAEGIFLGLGLTAEPLMYAVGFIALEGGPIPEFDHTDEQLAMLESAITAAMAELLRPVYIRDVPINIFGVMRDADGWEPAERSRHAGRGIPIG